MKVMPIRNDRLSDKVVHEILTQIKNGSLKQGDKLPAENLLAEQFGVSRGILREALTILQSQGYIRRKPKDGTYINADAHSELVNSSVDNVLKNATYRELMEFREALELKMVEKVIERADESDIEEISEIFSLDEKDESENNMDYYFHYKLAQVSRNSFFMNFIDTYYDLIYEIAKNSRKDPERQKLIFEEHMAIFEAIKARDKNAAAEAVKHHMNMVVEKAKNI